MTNKKFLNSTCKQIRKILVEKAFSHDHARDLVFEQGHSQKIPGAPGFRLAWYQFSLKESHKPFENKH